MAVPGTMGKILIVDLSTKQITVEVPDDELYLSYMGGYGLGAYYLYKMQKAGVDPLGPEAHLGFFAGLLTGTSAITGNRYFVVGKSPKTGTWGDANSGGTFGPKLKSAGVDGIIFHGISEEPVYLLVRDGGAELIPANDWWGMDTNDLEDRVTEKYDKHAGVASIGPPGERQQLLACIMNDKGRAAGRSGLGAVMGSKNLKAIVALRGAEIEMADKAKMQTAVTEHRNFMRKQGMFVAMSEYGTMGGTAACCEVGDTPIKNWGGVPGDFKTAEKISDDTVLALQKRKYHCWRCPIGCGGETEVPDGKYKSDTHKPEYETLGAFGTLCLNDNLESIHMCNQICNRQGLDTISVACTIGFAIECYENGLISDSDTGGLKLNWGNADAIVEATHAIADGTGIGKLMGDGIKVAAEKIGPACDEYAIHVSGEEVPMHDPRLNPGLATSYQMDATPGRHTQMSAWTIEAGFAPPGLYEKEFDKYQASGKGEAHAIVSNAFHTATAAGICMFGWCTLQPTCTTDSLTYTTGTEFTHEDVLTIGKRIATLRIAFNLREGIRNVDIPVPGRMIGQPPLEAGPLEGVTVDLATQVREYCSAMDWDPETGVPEQKTLEDLGLDFTIADLHG